MAIPDQDKSREEVKHKWPLRKYIPLFAGGWFASSCFRTAGSNLCLPPAEVSMYFLRWNG